MGSFRLPEIDHEPPRPILGGPTGLGTSATRLLTRDLTHDEDDDAPKEPPSGGVTIPELYCPDATRDGPDDTNLPNLIAAEDNCTLQEAVDATARIHDELMHTFEAEAAALTEAGSPQLGRFMAGLWAWMGGCRRWHATSPRYQPETRR